MTPLFSENFTCANYLFDFVTILAKLSTALHDIFVPCPLMLDLRQFSTIFLDDFRFNPIISAFLLFAIRQDFSNWLKKSVKFFSVKFDAGFLENRDIF